MYQALYRKWRPMTFSDVVGQRHVTETLRTQVQTNRSSHAYLFTGTRGTGKTTCAKILAKVANCLEPVNGEPCNRFTSCVGINNESLIDVSEIDAASYTGVDNIREIRDESAYAPAEAKMRVYIIDECHMLSKGASNALLKTLEEPPPHVLFILATTEPDKVPETVRSRCQMFTFRRLQPEDISTRLKEIAAAENIALDEAAADLLATLADGAMRNAVSMLDQCALSSKGTIGVEEVHAVIGLSTAVETLQLAKALAEGDSSLALNMLSDMYMDGKDLEAVLEGLMMLLRDLLVYRTTNNIKLMLGFYSKEDIDSIRISRLRLMHMINTIQDTLIAMKRSSNQRIDAELCLIMLSDETLAEGVEGLQMRVERLEDGYESLRRGGVVGTTTVMAGSLVANSPTQAAKAPAAPTATTASAVSTPPVPSTQHAAPTRHAAPMASTESDDSPPWDTDTSDQVRANEVSPEMAAPTMGEAEVSTRIAPDQTQSGEDGRSHSDLWKRILQRIEPNLPPSEYSFLKSVQTPILQGSRLCIVTDIPLMRNILKKTEILEAINREASIILGTDIKTDVVGSDRLGYEQTKLGSDDNLKKLADRQAEFDIIKVEE